MSRLYRRFIVSSLVALGAIVLIVVVLGFRNLTSYMRSFAWVEHTHEVLETVHGMRIEIDHVEADLRAGLAMNAREAANHSRTLALKMTRLTVDHPGQHARALQVVSAADSLALAIVARPETIAGLIDRIRRLAEEISRVEDALMDGRLENTKKAERRSLETYSALAGASVALVGVLSMCILLETRLHRQAQAILFESEERFRNAFEAAAIGMAIVSPEGRFLRVNRALTEILGYEESELLAIGFQTLTHPDDRATDFELVGKLLRAEIRSYRFEKRYHHKQGHVVYALIAGSLVRDTHGRALYFVTQVEDITSRKLAEAALAESESKFRVIFDNTFQFMGLMSLDGVVLNVNQTALDGAGLMREDVVGWPMWEIRCFATGQETKDRLRAAIAEARLGREVRYEMKIRGAGDQILDIDFSLKPIRDAHGNVVLLLPEGHNITERVFAENQARERALVIEAIADANPSFLYIYDLVRKCNIWSNNRILDVLGYHTQALSDLGERLIPSLIHPDDLERIAEHHGIVVGLPDREVREIEFRIRHASGAWRWMHARELVFRRDADGRAIHLLGAAEDVTERKENEAALIKAKDAAEAATRAKGQFLANMSHEIRTPMNGVVGMADLALATSLTSESRTYVEGIRSSADGLLAVVNDILDFSKVEAGKLEIERIPFDLHQLVGELVGGFAMKAKERGIDLESHVSARVPTRLSGDPNQLRQILINLIGNALKFTQAGSILVRIETTPAWEDDSGFVDLRITVKDTGVGIPANRLQAIFEPFEQADGSMTRRFGGTGLGLAITTKLVELMHGSISVTSVLGEGSTFLVALRLEKGTAALPAPQDTAFPPAHALDPLRILLVDDNYINQVVAGKMLERMGHTVTIASDGRKALEAWRGSAFDLILMDVQMPVMDGFEAIFAIRDEERARASHTLVIALTAHAMQGDRELCLSSGFDGYLTKPIHFASLAKAIADVQEFSGFRQPPAIL